VVIHPRFLGKKLRKTVVDTLKAEVVGSCIDGAHVIAVLRISDENVSRGVVEPLTGSVRYDVTYRAIMFRPFRNEVLDCVVKQVTAVSAVGRFWSFDYILPWHLVCRAFAARVLRRSGAVEHFRFACGVFLFVVCNVTPWMAV
jgi:DNA-directed RNA polymerase subunit E'/Rpb7